jgi:hypothetical protein
MPAGCESQLLVDLRTGSRGEHGPDDDGGHSRGRRSRRSVCGPSTNAALCGAVIWNSEPPKRERGGPAAVPGGPAPGRWPVAQSALGCHHRHRDSYHPPHRLAHRRGGRRQPGQRQRPGVLQGECYALHGLVDRCVKINQCVGCTLGDDAAVLEPAPPRRQAGGASMAWRSTRRLSTNAP